MYAIVLAMMLQGSVSLDDAEMFKEAVLQVMPCVAVTEDFNRLLRQRDWKKREYTFELLRYRGNWANWSGAQTRRLHELGEEVGFFRPRGHRTHEPVRQISANLEQLPR
jgi:hypothetical protein